jgi:CheY-like chemotaxis protein
MRKVERPKRNDSVPPRRLVLYVEDNDDNWSVAEMRLSSVYRLVRAANDREACTLLTKHAAELYIVLMDIELQGSRLDGIALTKLLRGRLPSGQIPDYARGVRPSNVPVVFVTAYHAAFGAALTEAGGNLVVPKPVEFRRLIRELTSMHLNAIGNDDDRKG